MDTTQEVTKLSRVSQVRELISLVPGKYPGAYTVRLNLPFKPVFCGELRPGPDGTFSKRIDPAKHIHLDSNSIAVSAALLNSDFQFKWIVVDILGKGKLVTTRRYMLANGKPFRYRDYEPQVALSLDLWGIDKARAWDLEEEKRERHRREIAAQGNLFTNVA